MKKLLIFGFGIVVAGSALALTLTPISPALNQTKTTASTVTHDEWNFVAGAINELTDVLSGVVWDNTKITFTKTLQTPILCLGNSTNCQSSWPSLWTQSGTDLNYAAGNVGIGVPAPVEKLEVAGNLVGTAFLHSSDARLKKDIYPITNALDKVNALNGVSFKWKDSGKEALGFIAQDVEKILPEIVSTSSATGLKAVGYANITAVLLEAIKEQQKQIEVLKLEIALLK